MNNENERDFCECDTCGWEGHDKLTCKTLNRYCDECLKGKMEQARANERKRLMERLLYLLWAHPKLERDDAELICEILKKKED